ncbi:hypothetical protein D3C75_787500 [compost metagenome]
MGQQLAFLRQRQRLMDPEMGTEQPHKGIQGLTVYLIPLQRQVALDGIQSIQQEMRLNLGIQRVQLYGPFLLLLRLHLPD